MTNEQMQSRRFLDWHKARSTLRFIQEQMAAGRSIQISTYTRSTVYRPKYASMFSADQRHCYLTDHKGRRSLDGCAIRAVA